jgi:hypothetical protein
MFLIPVLKLGIGKDILGTNVVKESSHADHDVFKGDEIEIAICVIKKIVGKVYAPQIA